MILFSKPIPNSKNYALDLKEILNILNKLGYSKSFPKLNSRIKRNRQCSSTKKYHS